MPDNVINFDKFRTGVDWMDRQHAELIEMTLELINSIGQDGGEHKVTGMLEFLDRYVTTHFSIEDDLIKSLKYPGKESHLAEHESFIFTLNNLEKELRSTGPSVYLSGNVKRHLLDWLVNHIGESDKEFAKFLIDSGNDKTPAELQIKSPISIDIKKKVLPEASVFQSRPPSSSHTLMPRELKISTNPSKYK